MSTPPPLLVFAGSTRAKSFNRQLATAAATYAGTAGAQVTHLELADFDLPLYNADLEARGTPAAAVKLKEIFHAHPAWIIASTPSTGSPAPSRATRSGPAAPSRLPARWWACSAPRQAHWAA